MSEEELYAGREQTLVKHFILRQYLQRFAHIIGFNWTTITYVDCFSGPWKSRSEGLQDTSFAIALEELCRARATHEKRGARRQLRCMFLERDAAAYARLKEFADKVTDATVETRNSDLAGAIPAILDFVKRGGAKSFPFFFIDPTGWTGFGMKTIAPLLRQQPGEVLINCMTDFIRRFLDHPDPWTKQQLADMFGASDVKERLEHLGDPQDREDALYRAYAENVRRTGNFAFTCTAAVLYPEIDRRFFHLIYATRNRKGVEVFKEVEKKAMAVQEQTRAEAKQRKRLRRSRQPELFSAMEMDTTQPIDALRDRYLQQAGQSIRALLESGRPVAYEEVWDRALSFPLVWESDLKGWIETWRKVGLLSIDGMQPRQRVPRLDEQNRLVWQGRKT